MASDAGASVQLVEKTPEELAAWLPGQVRNYAEERARAGEPEAVAASTARSHSDQVFPGGVPADGHHVMNLVVDDQVVGTLWMGRGFNGDEHTWVVFEVEIHPALRGRGHGRTAMRAAEEWTLANGGTRVALNVFGWNAVARSLYDSLGYRVMSTSMYKEL